MLRLPGKLTAKTFLARHWQKAPLFMPGAMPRVRPAMSRNELAWLATLEDVESRIVFTERDGGRTRYRLEDGPFDVAALSALPRNDWTLLVHDVEKHLPAMRRLFRQIPFIPDWRIDDLMVSFAVPGGGVGPHRDNYDVFLCQGIGVREWRYSTSDIPSDKAASNDLDLLQAFQAGEDHTTREGDVLYLPPGVAHWGTARRACMTYSIGMRAPAFYTDPDLALDEVRPGYISVEARRRAGANATTLGPMATELKQWLRPMPPDDAEITALMATPATLGALRLHGMTRIAYDETHVYVNGAGHALSQGAAGAVAALCTRRQLSHELAATLGRQCLRWMLARGAFELPYES